MASDIDGPVAQFNLLGAIIDDKRGRKIHDQVAKHIISRYYPRYGNARASVGYLETATRLTRGSVATATEDLIAWGYFTRVMGSGKRPTEYTPIWSSVLQPQDDTSVLQPQDASVLQPQDAKIPSVLPPQDQTYLQLPEYNSGILLDSNPRPSGPPVAAACAAPTSAGRDPFEGFWDVYPRRHQKAKAKLAWNRLAPDAALTARIVTAAIALSDHYVVHPVEKQWMKAPANWLDGEGWDEDLPAVFRDPKEAAIARAKDKPARQTAAPSTPQGAPIRIVGGRTTMPRGEHLVDIVSAVHGDEPGGGYGVSLVLQPTNGRAAWDHTYFIAHDMDDEREAGQKCSRSFTFAIGGNPDSGDIPEPDGKRVWALVGKTVEYRAP